MSKKFVFIPQEIYQIENLSIKEKFYLSIIYTHSLETGYFYGSNEYIANEYKQTLRQIKFTLAKLENNNWIKRQVVNKDFINKRRIFINYEKDENFKNLKECTSHKYKNVKAGYKNVNAGNKNVQSGLQNCNDHLYIKNKDKININNNTFSPSESSFESDKKIEKEYINIPELPLVKITEKEKENLKKHYNDDLMFLKAVRFFNEYLEEHPEKVTGKKAYKRHATVLKGWVYEKFLKLDILEKQYVKANAQFDDYINRKKDGY